MLWRSGLPSRREGASLPGPDPTVGSSLQENVFPTEEVRREKEASIRLRHASSHPTSTPPPSFVLKGKEEGCGSEGRTNASLCRHTPPAPP
jgi:hypothetical protein